MTCVAIEAFCECAGDPIPCGWLGGQLLPLGHVSRRPVLHHRAGLDELPEDLRLPVSARPLGRVTVPEQTSRIRSASDRTVVRTSRGRVTEDPKYQTLTRRLPPVPRLARAKSHPEYDREPPVETLFKFLVEKWPCRK